MKRHYHPMKAYCEASDGSHDIVQLVSFAGASCFMKNRAAEEGRWFMINHVNALVRELWHT